MVITVEDHQEKECVAPQSWCYKKKGSSNVDELWWPTFLSAGSDRELKYIREKRQVEFKSDKWHPLPIKKIKMLGCKFSFNLL